VPTPSSRSATLPSKLGLPTIKMRVRQVQPGELGFIFSQADSGEVVCAPFDGCVVGRFRPHPCSPGAFSPQPSQCVGLYNSSHDLFLEIDFSCMLGFSERCVCSNVPWRTHSEFQARALIACPAARCPSWIAPGPLGSPFTSLCPNEILPNAWFRNTSRGAGFPSLPK
jgi:hypothetical protein